MQNQSVKIQDFRQWYESWKNLQLLMIAGPCSAESFDQLEQCIKVMQNYPTEWPVLRLGIWKPRTRPGGFEGNLDALQWIKELKSKYDFKCAVEVATPEHVHLAKSAGIDILWIGARTVGLPFVVDDLAKALKNFLDTPVLVKNPLSPDLGLWAGAVERLLLQDLSKIAIVHRGFSWPYAQELRNWPMWSMVAQMKLQFPTITVLGDPSHIAGKANLVEKVSLDALHFGCDGLMVETHPRPENALTDAKQQINLKQMVELLKQCKRPETSKEQSSISYWRMHIDEIDQQLMHLLKKRDEITGHIALTKKDQQLQVVDYDRFQKMLDVRKDWFNKGELEDQKFIDQLFNLLHERSIQRQLKIVSKSDSH
jgi:chorismate mutase